MHSCIVIESVHLVVHLNSKECLQVSDARKFVKDDFHTHILSTGLGEYQLHCPALTVAVQQKMPKMIM